MGKIAGAFCLDNSECAVIMGPVGSGKTTAFLQRIARHAYEQRPYQGVRRTRFAIVRNTGPQLNDTTIKSNEDIEKYLEVPVMGTIPHIVVSKCLPELGAYEPLLQGRFERSAQAVEGRC